MLWACLLLPSLSLDVYARAAAAEALRRPFVVSSGGRCPQVVAADAPARAAGIRRGQLISAALALAPGIVLRERDSGAESAALAEIATLALAFTPGVSIAPPDAVLAEIGGSLRLFGGLSLLLEQLVARTEARGYATQIALAPTPSAALLLARAGAQPVLDVQELPAALAPLPLALFDIDSDARAALEAAGITTCGEAQALPRAGLARRCGPRLIDALDRALGRVADPRVPYQPPPRFERRLPLPCPVEGSEALGFGVGRLVHELASWLAARGLGVMRLSLTLVHERQLRERGIASTTVSFALGAPARTSAHLQTILRERLARTALPGPVEAIVLASDETAPLAGRSLVLLPGGEATAATVPLLERLRSRLADDAVVLLEARAEHRPECAMRMIPATQAALVSPPAAPRPLWLLDVAQPLHTARDEAPWILRDGPERIESGWWDGHDLRRDYFVAETPQGEIAWIYRDHRYGTDAGEWFLHGLFA
jgi:protein ImuB